MFRRMNIYEFSICTVFTQRDAFNAYIHIYTNLCVQFIHHPFRWWCLCMVSQKRRGRFLCPVRRDPAKMPCVRCVAMRTHCVYASALCSFRIPFRLYTYRETTKAHRMLIVFHRIIGWETCAHTAFVHTFCAKRPAQCGSSHGISIIRFCMRSGWAGNAWQTSPKTTLGDDNVDVLGECFACTACVSYANCVRCCKALQRMYVYKILASRYSRRLSCANVQYISVPYAAIAGKWRVATGQPSNPGRQSRQSVLLTPSSFGRDRRGAEQLNDQYPLKSQLCNWIVRCLSPPRLSVSLYVFKRVAATYALEQNRKRDEHQVRRQTSMCSYIIASIHTLHIWFIHTTPGSATLNTELHRLFHTQMLPQMPPATGDSRVTDMPARETYWVWCSQKLEDTTSPSAMHTCIDTYNITFAFVVATHRQIRMLSTWRDLRDHCATSQ